MWSSAQQAHHSHGTTSRRESASARFHEFIDFLRHLPTAFGKPSDTLAIDDRIGEDQDGPKLNEGNATQVVLGIRQSNQSNAWETPRVFQLFIEVGSGTMKPRSFLALVDTGADYNCINDEDAKGLKQLGHSWQKSKDFRALGANGFEVVSKAKMSFEFMAKGGRRVFHDEFFYITEELPYAIILGLPWLQKSNYLREDRSVLPIRRLTAEQEAEYDQRKKDSQATRDAARELRRRSAAQERERERAAAADRQMSASEHGSKAG